ncbi:hypothetical protein POK33_38235 [Burkholderia cenocepacia]|uniref:hypothetical protein n=1 Tax=Burkholderia cenocepacia TaxID=95486 RepID=UPI0023BA2489|nr:hypothetical protein [Burkholderia cenocepacia]MDF0506595.1 hypothetical protein [Burkholderia cenocepacia]
MKMPVQACFASLVFRLYVCGLAVITGLMAFFEAGSMPAAIARSDSGSLLPWMMLTCGIVGLGDVLFNDLGALGVRIQRMRTHRHFGFSAIAFCHVYQCLIALIALRSMWVAFFSLWNALLVVAFSLLDAHQRSKETKCPQRCN